MKRLSAAIFLVGPVRWRSLGFAVCRRFSWRHPFQRYDASGMWRSVELFGVRFYRWQQ